MDFTSTAIIEIDVIEKFAVLITGRRASLMKLYTMLILVCDVVLCILADMGSTATLSKVILRAAGFTETVHIDHVGLR